MRAAKAALLLIVSVSLTGAPALAVSQRWSDRDWDECRGRNADRAILACTRLLRNRNESPEKLAEAHLRRGINLRNTGETARAIADYTEVIRLAPKYDYAYVLRGDAWRIFGDHERAIADYTQAISLDAKTSDAYSGRAASRRAKEEFGPAIADYTEAIGLEPKEADNYGGRALAWMFEGEVDKALADVAQAIQLDPQNSAYHRYHGYFLFVKGDFAAAANAFSRSLETETEVWTENDAYAALWRYLARERGAPSGLEELVRDSARMDNRVWPYPVVELYLGRRSAEDLRKSATNADEQCEASFYAGQSLLIHHAREAAAKALAEAARICPRSEMEYWVATSDLKAITTRP